MSSYIPYTQEERDRAHRTDLIALLRGQGEVLKRSGTEYEWHISGQKVTIRDQGGDPAHLLPNPLYTPAVAGDGLGHEHRSVTLERLSGFGIGTAPVLRHGDRRGAVLLSEMRHFSHHAGRKSQYLLYGIPAHPAAISGDFGRGG